MFRIFFILGALFLANGGTVAAESLPPTTVAYRGELRIEAGSLALTGSIHATPGRERRALHLEGTRVPGKVLITRRDQGVVWVVEPASKSYFRVTIPKSTDAANNLVSGAILEREQLGAETLDGIEVTKYRVAFAHGENGRLSGHMWVTRENIVLRVVGEVKQGDRMVPYRMTLSNLDIGELPEELFEPPKDYTLVAPSHPTKGVLTRPAARAGRNR